MLCREFYQMLSDMQINISGGAKTSEYIFFKIFVTFLSSLFNNFLKIDSQNVTSQIDDFDRRLCAPLKD